MHCLRDADSIKDFLEASFHSDLHKLISERMTELAEYSDYDISELVNFLVVDPGDSLAIVEQELGFPIDYISNPWESFVNHQCWHEIIYVLRDDGFGLILLIPTQRLTDSRLSYLCNKHSVPVEELDP